MTEQSVPDAHQELRERAQWNKPRYFGKGVTARHMGFSDGVDAVLALLDEPTLLSLLGMRQVGWRIPDDAGPDAGIVHDETDDDHPYHHECEPVYVKEAPRA